MDGERWRRGGQQRRVRIQTQNENEIEIENEFKRRRRGDPQRVGTPEDLLTRNACSDTDTHCFCLQKEKNIN